MLLSEEDIRTCAKIAGHGNTAVLGDVVSRVRKKSFVS